MNKSLNNRGFAITGILYTIFVLFSLVLVSILAGLSSKKTFQEKSIESLEKGYIFDEIASDEITSTDSLKSGKYHFLFTITKDGVNEEIDCYSYLSSFSLSETDRDIEYTTYTCNKLKKLSNITVDFVGYYPFNYDSQNNSVGSEVS